MSFQPRRVQDEDRGVHEERRVEGDEGLVDAPEIGLGLIRVGVLDELEEHHTRHAAARANLIGGGGHEGAQAPGTAGRALEMSGGEPVEVYIGNKRITIAVPPIDDVTDTTAAGDAFAAGYLTAGDVSPEAATEVGCRAAARLLTSRRSWSGAETGWNP